MSSTLSIRLRKCILMNFALLLFVMLSVSLLRDGQDTYFRWGPNSDLHIMGVRIDNYAKYVGLQVFLCVVEVIGVIVNEIASPILNFNIYNPDKKVIDEFSKWELQVMANCMWTINSLMKALFVVVTISQLDIAILRVLYSEITAIYTIHMLLSEKKFVRQSSYVPVDQSVPLETPVEGDVEIETV